MTQPHFRTIAEVLRYRAEVQEHSPAYTFLRDGEVEDRTLTYGELDRESRTLAAMLQQWRIQRPLLVYPPGLEFITAFFACAYAGITPVPAGLPHVTRVGRSLTRLSAVAIDAVADVVLSTSRVIERTTGDPDFSKRAPEMARMRWLATDRLDGEIIEPSKPPEPQDEMSAFIQYTSGSTSTPKGVVVTHRSLLHNLAYCNAVEENDGDTISVSWLPHSHDMGLIEAILLPAFGGYRAYLMSPASFLSRPARWLEAITRLRATNSGGPNFAFDLCVDKLSLQEEESLDLRSWRVAYNGSETIRKETLIRFRDKFQKRGFCWNAFYPVYGLAESTLLVSSGRPADVPVFQDVDAEALGEGILRTPQTDRIKTISLVASGRASFGTRIVVANPETLAECEPGQIGEIWVASPSVAAGYWRRHDESERTFKAYLAGQNDGPFLRTGDLGFLSEGHLFVTGRIKDMINIRGFKHYPQDIEHTVAQSHPLVFRNGCAAFGVDCDGSDRLVLVVEIRLKLLQTTGDMADQAITAIQDSVTRHHGVAIHALALTSFGTIPKTTSGKLQRQACRRFFMDGTLPVMRVWSRNPHFSHVGAI